MVRRKSPYLLLIWLFSAALLAGPAAPLRAQPAAKPAAPGTRLSAIQFVGLQNVKESFLREALAMKPGDGFTPALLEKDRQVLIGMGFFRSVGASQRTDSGKTEVTFRVVEWPKVIHIRVLGNTVVDRKTIQEVISTQVGQVFCAPQLKDDIRAIEQLYRERGYVARISERLLDEATRSGILRFEVLELRIEEVQVEGAPKKLCLRCRKELSQVDGQLYRPETVSLDQQRLLQVRGVTSAVPRVEVTAPGKVRIRWLLNPPADTLEEKPTEG